MQDERKRKHRGHIKRAAKCLQCVDITAREFVKNFEENLRVRGKRSYAPPNMLVDLIEQSVERGCGRVIAAIRNPEDACSPDESPRCDAAIVYIWDQRRCYYWLSTHRASSGKDARHRPHPDAVKLLMISAMDHAQAMDLTFDADGVITA